MLLSRQQLVQHKLLAHLNIGHGFILFFLAQLSVDSQKAGKAQYRAGSTQLIIASVNQQSGHIINCIAHLARHRPLPNQGVQLQLVHRKIFGNFFGSTQHAGGANSFMSILGILFSTIMIGLGRAKFTPHIVFNIVTNFVDSHIC